MVGQVGSYVRANRKVRLGINGFGRIGRACYRILSQRTEEFDVVAVNDLTDLGTLAHLLAFDSTFGRFPAAVEHVADNELKIGEDRVTVFSERDPAKLPWGELGVEVVIDATGVFTTGDALRQHVAGGAKRVILTAPGKGGLDATVVLGVNEGTIQPDHQVVSNASCTTNCLAPVAKVLHEAFGIEHGQMTTIHAFTSSQRLLDLPHKDLRRGRGIMNNIIPTTTGAARAVGVVLPELQGHLDGMAIRVPVSDGSLVDLTVRLRQDVTAEQVNAAVQAAANGPLANIIHYETQPIVSVDIIGQPQSSVFDSALTNVLGDRMVKVLSWYDNEWGYSSRVVDLAAYLANLSD